MSQGQPFIWKSSLDGPSELGGAESLGISKAGSNNDSQVDMVSYMAPACQLCGVRVQKRTMALLTLMTDTSVSPGIPLVPFKLLPKCWISEGVNLSK